jgi:mono/diheme cytochrome c family protein
MRSALLALPLAALAGCAALSGDRDAPPAEPPGLAPGDVVATGGGLYAQYCASCHGATGHGDGPTADSLKTPPGDLTQLAGRWGTPLDRERLAAFIDGRDAPRAHGSPDMPVWGERLYEGERADSSPREAARRGTILLILEYLQTLQQPAGTPAEG